MNKKKYCLILAVMIVVAAVMLSGCAKKLDEPVFVRNLVCSSDMDASVEFITNNDYELSVKSIEIPDMPEGLSLNFYDEQIGEWTKYDVHTLSFGIGADQLSESGGLKEDFIFHEIIVKWDDGTETRADIGTIHMAAYDDDFILESGGGGSSSQDGTFVTYRTRYYAPKDMEITGVNMPYLDELEGIIDNLCINDTPVSSISKETPMAFGEDESFELSYTKNEEAAMAYGKISLEGLIEGQLASGEAFADIFHMSGSLGRKMPDWAEAQIANANSSSK